MAISLSWQLLAQPQLWQLLVLAPLLIVSSLLITSIRRRRSPGQGALNLPPGPVRVPVLGNLHQLGSLPHRSLRELARRHGPVMLLHLGTVRTVVISSASAAKEVMKDQDVSCCSRPSSPGPSRLSYGLRDVAFAPYGEYWREMRRVFIVELLSMRRVKAAWGARQEQVQKLVRVLSQGQKKKKPVALDEHIFRLADGIIGTVAFGNVYGTEMLAAHEDKERRFHQVLDDAMDMLASFSAEDFFPNAAGRLVDRLTGLVSRRERIFKELDAFYETVIRQHLDPARPKPSNGGDLVDVLLSLPNEPRGTLSFTMDHVKALLMNTFVGGIDTSSVTILWAMSELIRKPRVLKKVQEEIRAVVGSNGSDREPRVQPDDVPKLSYLKMVVKETLRLHPPATLLVPRETTRHVKISGHDVPAKTRVLVNAWAIGRDAASWGEDAEEFDPDRFEPAARSAGVDFHGAHFELLPFGSGRRVCPGIAMGAATVEFTLASLLCSFDWALPEGTRAEELSMEEAGGLTFHRKTPLVLVPTAHPLRRPAAAVSVR
ncbi:4-hydroxyphenylacetaldehyde oxime monooxygenase [Brachypodium distachyon]|uniref:4-hydroxyphenylacetaldehyde oxime monooxygenase n=1 Tax=Brachypodium distachyon TaxID=15368 RepID=I1GSN0_BRADI|nr:4-hydroxyphenylacetaldehyde oxime monooxygenase [Brachypodium distachyon]KQK15379.1 hypothetical protein BRADI_1g22340v3 [Brachypodium distachyon]|eukprot:XP_003559997.1 4-hydroxyphenylacetaldehyde oxime monooxygenase [Brachypodium distachyon]